MKYDIPANSYIKQIVINDKDVDIQYAERKKVALLFISLNSHYWPYLKQVVKDCRQNFLPHHKVDYFVWTDINSNITKESRDSQFKDLDEKLNKCKTEEGMKEVVETFIRLFVMFDKFEPETARAIADGLPKYGLTLKRDPEKTWIESTNTNNEEVAIHLTSCSKALVEAVYQGVQETAKGVNVIDTDSVEWPAPTLMRYHLFLNEEEKLKDYDYIFYLDADMRVVDKISDELLTEGLLAAEHPMYSLRKEYVPPYEPNPGSTAYIPRPGKVVDENGKKRFKPFYYAGGFQGGKADEFIKAMKEMKKNIDLDFDKNYVAVWNDESHWNKYLFDYQGPTVVLSPAYVYPDSLIKEYYEKLWGCSYQPKIITLTKPFTLSKEGGEAINKMI